MNLRNAALSAAVATALIAGPVSARQAPTDTRTSAKVHADRLFGFGWGWFFLLALIAGGVVYLVNHDNPASP